MFCEFPQAEANQGQISNLNLILTSILKILCTHRDMHTNPAQASWLVLEILQWLRRLGGVCKFVFAQRYILCVDTCHMCVLSVYYIFFLAHSCYKMGGLKGSPPTSVGSQLQILAIYPLGMPSKAHWYLPPGADILHLWVKLCPQQPPHPTHLYSLGMLLCIHHLYCFVLPSSPLLGFVSKSSLLYIP